MVAIVAPDAIHMPEHPEQRPWLVVWVAKNGDSIFADSLSDIVSVLIPGYEDLDDEDDDDPHLNARIDALAPMAKDAQALMTAHLAAGEIRLTEAELTAAFQDKEQPVSLEKWNPSEPLILLTTTYEPFTDATPPEGAILWLDPTNEAAFLGSLNKIGAGELWVIGR